MRRPTAGYRGGPTDDYLDDGIALRLPFRRRFTGGTRVGSAEVGFDCVGDPWQLEPDMDALVDALRWLHAHPEERRAMTATGQARVAEIWTWERAVGDARDRIGALLQPLRAKQPGQLKPWTAPGSGGQPAIGAPA